MRTWLENPLTEAENEGEKERRSADALEETRVEGIQKVEGWRRAEKTESTAILLLIEILRGRS